MIEFFFSSVENDRDPENQEGKTNEERCGFGFGGFIFKGQRKP